MKYIFLFIVLICTSHGLTVHASPLHKGKRLIIFIYNFLSFYFLMHLIFSFVVRSSLLMKRCTTGGQLGDCGIGGECVTDDDCLPGLYCDTIIGVCYD
jgi:hypothetical protein